MMRGVWCFCGLFRSEFSSRFLFSFSLRGGGGGGGRGERKNGVDCVFVCCSGAWIVLPSYMVYAFGRDILHGLAIASGDSTSKPARAASPSKDD